MGKGGYSTENYFPANSRKIKEYVMEVIVSLKDIGNSTVSMNMDIVGDNKSDTPTPAIVMATAIRALFDAQILDKIGAEIIVGLENKQNPSDTINKIFGINNDTHKNRVDKPQRKS